MRKTNELSCGCGCVFRSYGARDAGCPRCGNRCYADGPTAPVQRVRVVRAPSLHSSLDDAYPVRDMGERMICSLGDLT